MTWKAELIPELAGYTVEWAEPENYYLSRRNVIYHSQDLMPPFARVGEIPIPRWRSAVGRSRLGQRLLRQMVYNLMPLGDGSVFITFDKQVGLLKNGEYHPAEGMLRPCRVLRGGCAIDGKGNICFGEYLANKERGEMRVYRWPAEGGSLQSAYVFSPGQIRHIHGVYYDGFTDSIFCLTGDDRDECRILRTQDGFETVEVIGSGDESWRAVSVLFGKDYIYFGTDAEHVQNRIFRLRRTSLDREDIGMVDGTVFYSQQVGGDMFFTTTAENAPSQRDNVASIWHVSDNLDVNKIVSFGKDRWPAGPFMFGTIHFPCRSFLDHTYFSLLALKGDGETYRLTK